MSLVVTSLSALLGSGLPDGWLWSTMMELAALLVKSGRVCEECFMAAGAWLSDMAFKPFPGGTRASPCQANFLCKGGSKLHKILET